MGAHCALLMVGAPPCPEDDMLKEIEFVTLVQSMAMLNSSVMSTVVAFASVDSACTRASWPGTNPVRAGSGPIHSVAGTKARKPNG